MTKRFIISYSTPDRAIAEEVREQLTKAGYEVWIAHEDIRGSVDWTKTILDTIDSRDGLVLVWSEDAAKSDDVREEIRLARVFLKPIFPIHAHPKREVPSLPNEIKNLQVIHMGSLESNIAELKERLADPIKSDIRFAALAENGIIPKAPNPYFVGRGRELKSLFIDSRGYRGVTRQDIPIAITGLAGIGKTHLVLAFAYRFNLFFPEGVYWVDTPNGIVNEFGKIGPHLGVKRLREERPSDYADRVLENLRLLHNGLIIFDNVTNFSEFRQWCPTGNASCSVFLTTRLAPRGFPAWVMNLTELDPESAYNLLIARRKDKEIISQDKAQRDALQELCRITGNHPLALELIAAHLQSEFIRPSDYLKEIQPDPLARLDDEKKPEMSLDAGIANLPEKLLHHNYASLDERLVDPYFLLMCCFAPFGINEELILQSYGKRSEGGRALDQLSNVSFIRREHSNTLSLHPLVVQFGRNLLKHKDFDYAGKFIDVILAFLRAHENNLTSEEVRREKPHINEALRVAQDSALWDACATLHEYEAIIEVGIREKIDLFKKAQEIIAQYLPQQKKRLLSLLLQLGKAYRTAGQLNDALGEFNHAEMLYREIKDIAPAEAASLRFELGSTHLTLGRYAEAEKTLSDALDIALTADLDKSAPEVLQLRQALAEHALAIGDYDKAESSFTEIFNDRKKFYVTQPDTNSADGLSSAYADLSRLSLARAHYTNAIQAANDALSITKEYHSESDPDCSNLFLLLGTIYYEAGDYGKAEELLEKASSDFLTTFGKLHPNYAKTLIALGEVYRKQGRFNKAEKVVVQVAIAIFELVYGEDHPSVAEALAVQAKIYDHRCEFVQEQEAWERILRIQHDFYKEQHPALATTHYDYASLFLRKGEYNKAAEHLESSLRITEQSFGKTHAEYFGRLVRLATCRYEQQQYSHAQEILDEAKGLQHAIFGDSNHPYIARMLQLQSEILRRLGKFKDALEIIDQTIEMKTAIYGKEEHPSVAEAFEVKVKIYHHLGEKTEAKKLIDRTLEIRLKTYGENHPETSRSIHDLGSYYLRLGQYQAAAEQFERARQVTASVFGKNHPDYVERTLHLADARNEHGEYRSAIDLVEEVEDVLPSGNHVLRARWLQLMSELQRRMGQFITALDFIGQAIAMKEAIYKKDHPSVAEALEVQAKIYDHLDRLAQEQEAWEKILEIQRNSYPEQHPTLAATYHKYANLYVKKGEYVKALELLDKSLDITEKTIGKKHASYFERLVLRSSCFYEQQEYLRAQKVLDEAEGLQHEIFLNSSHPYIARMLQLQSEILRRLGKFKDALEIIDQTIEMKTAIYGKEEHPSVAEALGVKVAIMLDQRQVAECSEILDKIEHIRGSFYGKNHPEYAGYQLLRADWYSKDGQYDQAREILQQSLQTCLSIFSSEHPETLRRKIELARLARMVNDIVGAESQINGVREAIGAKLDTEDSLIVAEMYQVLSYIGRAQGNYRAALAELEKAIRIKNRIFGSESPAVIELQNERAGALILFHRLTEANDVIESTLRNIEPDQPLYRLLRSDLMAQRGILQCHKREYDQAFESLEEAIKIRKELLGKNNVELARLYVEEAVVLRHQQKYNEALTNLLSAHRIDNIHFSDENHVNFARILLEQGQTYLDKESDLILAQEHLKESLQIYTAKPHRNVKQHADAVEALGRVFLKTGRSRDAFEMFEKALNIRMANYGGSHPEIAETLHNQAKALLNMSEANKNEEAKTKARQKLEQALLMLRQRDDDNAKLISDIERTLADT